MSEWPPLVKVCTEKWCKKSKRNWVEVPWLNGPIISHKCFGQKGLVPSIAYLVPGI